MSTINDTRALLRLFVQSGARDLHLRIGDYQLFIARPGGEANPMRAAAAAPVTAVAAESFVVSAPHIASLVSTLAVGAWIEPGGTVAELELLGEPILLPADRAGRIDAVLMEPGALAEYGAPIVRIAAA